MRSIAAFALLALTGCYEYERVDWIIDVERGAATLRLADLRADKAQADDTLNEVLSSLMQGTAIEDRYPRARVVRKDLEPRGEHLDFVAELRFDDPAALGLERWDDRRGWRFCPSEPAMFIVESNAAWRDASGCVVWRRRSDVLRVSERMVAPASPHSLLPTWQRWDAAGRPMPAAEGVTPAAPAAGP